MSFCSKCNNYANISLTKTTPYQVCDKCGFEEKIEGTFKIAEIKGILFSSLSNQNEIEESDIILMKRRILDPTVSYSKNVICPKCKGKVKFSFDNNNNYIYICVECKHVFK